jgi:hypothetical protein
LFSNFNTRLVNKEKNSNQWPIGKLNFFMANKEFTPPILVSVEEHVIVPSLFPDSTLAYNNRAGYTPNVLADARSTLIGAVISKLLSIFVAEH